MDKDTRESIEDAIEMDTNYRVVNVTNVWSNGKKIRRYQGQGENTKWHNPDDGYRKMVAILVEENKYNE